MTPLVAMQPPLGVGPPQLMEYVPVALSTPIVDVKPVKVPEAVVLREELHAAAVVVVVVVGVVESSFFAHDTMITATLQIKTSRLIIFFIITSFIKEKCRIIPRFMYRVWC
jgi:hypothetical protein